MKNHRLWKLNRELKRAVPKAAETLFEPFRHITYVPLYDRYKARKTRVTDGRFAATAEVGIFLIFPTNGLLRSHLTMIEAMLSQGISPVVVSNLPLSQEDRATLKEIVYKIIERPNIGYDFGGYRDGIQSIVDNLHNLNRLWILNDSAWLLDQYGGWFEEARSLKVDFVGAVSNFGVRKVDFWDHGKIKWNFSTENRRFHYVSSSWCIGERILSDPNFIRFWKNLQIRDSKQLTVRRGEVGFSQWVIKNHYSHSATNEIKELPSALAALGDIELNDVAHNLIVIGQTNMEVKNAVLKLDPTSSFGRHARITLCLSAVARFGYLISMPYYIIQNGRLPFFKKSLFTSLPETAELALKILEHLPNSTKLEIYKEASDLVNKKLVEDGVST